MMYNILYIYIYNLYEYNNMLVIKVRRDVNATNRTSENNINKYILNAGMYSTIR